MEKHKCKLCLKSFANGRALGGHMRSHMRNLYVTPKPPHPPPSSSSETEPSRNATARQRSKRIRRPQTSWVVPDQQHFREFDREYLKKLKTPESSTAEPLSSISGTSPEEDLAYCLILLSRDKWTNEEDDDDDREREDTEPGSESESDPPTRTKYRCETCNKSFRSYQALGGHRASHKKIKLNHHESNFQTHNFEKIHECPVCFKVFASGQALGGHKRSHVTASSSSMATNKVTEKQSIRHFDLNLPASIDDDDEVSQIEESVVSDGEFVKPH